MSLSPACTIGGNPTPAIVAASSTIPGALANPAGVVFWFLTAIAADDLTGQAGVAAVNASLSINQTNKTFTFTSPSGTGKAVIFQSTVGISPQSVQGAGRDINGNIVAAWTTTFKVNLPAGNGNFVVAVGETTEQDPATGYVSIINQASRAAGSPPEFVVALSSYLPTGTRQSVQVDGYSATGDGGQGIFDWTPTYSGTADAIHIYPTGHSSGNPGAWVRRLSEDEPITLGMFGGKVDATSLTHSAAGYQVVGTDDTAAVQAMLDYNDVTTTTSGGKRRRKTKINTSDFKYAAGIADDRSRARLTQPVQMNDNDGFGDGLGNYTTEFDGEGTALSGLVALDYVGPAVISGNCSAFCPTPVLDPNGSGEMLMPICQNGVAGTVPAGASLGASLPQSTVHVGTTKGWPTAGQFVYRNEATGFRCVVAFTGRTSTSFTGCSYTPAPPNGLTFDAADQITTLQSPQWNLTEYDCGDLSATNFTNAFTFEFFINRCDASAYMQANYPTSWVSSMLGSGGQVGPAAHTVLNNSTIYMQEDNAFGVPRYFFQLGTSGGSVNLMTSTSVDGTPAANTLVHVAFTWDGSTVRMFINGNLPTGGGAVPSGALGGAMAQTWYENFTFFSGKNLAWPFILGNTNVFNSVPCLMGRMRVSNTCRYTANFTPPLPSAVTPDGHTRWYLDFNPSSIPSRPTLAGAYSIAQVGCGVLGGLSGSTGVKYWMRNYSSTQPYTSFTKIRRQTIQSFGECIALNAVLDAEVGEDCLFIGATRGIVFDNYSYNSGVGSHCKFLQMNASTGGANCHSIEMFFGQGQQYSYVKEGWASANSACHWCIVSTFADLVVESGYPNNFTQGVLAIVQSSSIARFKATIIDSPPGYGVAGILFAPASGGTTRLFYDASYAGMGNSSGKPLVLIGTANCPVHISVPNYSPPAYYVSFQGEAAASLAASYLAPGNPVAYPVVIHGPPCTTPGGHVTAICDPNFPGPVLIEEQEAMGRFQVTMTDANYTFNAANGDAQWRDYRITANAITANRVITFPANPGKKYSGEMVNTSGHTVTITRAGSSSPFGPISGSTSFDLEDNGTDIVAR